VARPKNPPMLSGVQFVAIVVLTIAVFLIVDFGRRSTASYYVSQAQKDLKAEIEAELLLQQELERRLETVKSDAYVEKWAREEAHMVHLGDRPLILVTPTAPQQAPENVRPVVVIEPERAAPPWHAWWQLFFDSEPGSLNLG
jgi:cell division protein FtsB